MRPPLPVAFARPPLPQHADFVPLGGIRHDLDLLLASHRGDLARDLADQVGSDRDARM